MNFALRLTRQEYELPTNKHEEMNYQTVYAHADWSPEHSYKEYEITRYKSGGGQVFYQPEQGFGKYRYYPTDAKLDTAVNRIYATVRKQGGTMETEQD